MEEMEIVAMKKSRKQFWMGFLSAVVVFLGIGAVAFFLILSIWGAGSRSEKEARSLVTQENRVQQKLGLLESYIRGYFLYDVDDRQMEDYLYYGMMAGLGDPYAAYYNEQETKSMLDSSNRKLLRRRCGIFTEYDDRRNFGCQSL